MSKKASKRVQKVAEKKAAVRAVRKPRSPPVVRIAPAVFKEVCGLINDEAIYRMRSQKASADRQMLLAEEFLRLGISIDATTLCTVCAAVRNIQDPICTHCPEAS